MKARTPKPFGEAEYNISADYRSHFEEMRDSSVATKSRVGISKGTGLATEALSLLMLLRDTTRIRIPKAQPLAASPVTGQNRVKGVKRPFKFLKKF